MVNQNYIRTFQAGKHPNLQLKDQEPVKSSSSLAL